MTGALKWSWPALAASGVPHTVTTTHGLRAGMLVRSTGGVELGYIWSAGNAWMWQTPDGHHGERSSQTAAVRVLREAYELRREGASPQASPQASGLRPALRPPKPQASPQASGLRPPKPQASPQASASALRPPKPQPSGLSPQASPQPEPPMRRIKWGPQAPDLTAAVEAVLRRRDGK